MTGIEDTDGWEGCNNRDEVLDVLADQQAGRDALAATMRANAQHLTEQEESLDNARAAFMDVMYPVIEAWGDVPGTNVPCGAMRSTNWMYESLSDKGIWFRHDCTDHGYDLAVSESFLLPWEFITGPQETAEALAQRLRQERAEVAQQQLERAQQALIRAQAELEEAEKS
jgi:hypothetical protein